METQAHPTDARRAILAGNAPAGMVVDGDLDLSFCDVTTLPRDLTVRGSLELRGTGVSAVPENLMVTRSLGLRGAPIRSLPEGFTILDDVDLSDTLIKELPPGIYVGGNLDLSGTPITKLPAELTVDVHLRFGGSTAHVLPDEFLTTAPDIADRSDEERRGNWIGGSIDLRGTPLASAWERLQVEVDRRQAQVHSSAARPTVKSTTKGPRSIDDGLPPLHPRDRGRCR